MRYAAIDCGSNSFRIYIAEVIDNNVKELFRDLKMVQLGSKLDENGGIIDNATSERCIAALKGFKQVSAQYCCSSIFCVGTSALRSASNANDFINEVYSKIGINIEIIDGYTEARYSYYGATEGFSLIEGLAVLDIGGGSTEIAVCSENDLHGKSIKAGSVRLANIYCNENKILSDNNYLKLVCHVENLWNDKIGSNKNNIQKLIGVAGTITTLAAIYQQLETYQPSIIKDTVLTVDIIKSMYHKLNKLTAQQRLQVKGISSIKRAETITAGTAILLATLNYFKINEVVIRDSCLLQGIIFDKILNN